MDILAIIGSVLRRWYIVTPIVLVAAALALTVQSNTPSQYQAAGSVLLANPELDPSRLPLTSSILDDVVADLQAAADADEFAPATEVSVYRRDVTAIGVDLSAGSEDEVREGVEAVSDALAEILAAIQEENDIPAADRTEVLPGGIEVAVDDGSFETGGQIAASSVINLSDPTAGIVNPFGASAQTARVLEVALESDEGRLAMAQRAGRGVAFDITQETRDVAPIVQITTLGSDPELVLEDFDLVVDVLGDELDARQATAQVPESRRVILEVLAAPRGVMDVSPPVSRVAAAVLGLGGLLGVGIALLVESIDSRRRGRSEETELRDSWDADPEWAGDATAPDEPTTGASQPAQTS